MMQNNKLGENTLYVQRMFSVSKTRQFADNEQAAYEGRGKTFWQKHKKKILGAAALATAGGLGYTFRNEIRYGWANEDNIKKQLEEADRLMKTGDLDDAYKALCEAESALKKVYYSIWKLPEADSKVSSRAGRQKKFKEGIPFWKALVNRLVSHATPFFPSADERPKAEKIKKKGEEIIAWLDSLN